MAKRFKHLLKALFVVWALAFTFTLNFTTCDFQSVAFAQKPGIKDRVKGKIDSAKQTIKDVKEGVEATKEGLDFAAHAMMFAQGTGPADLVGRSLEQTLVICCAGLGATLILYAKRKKKDKVEVPKTSGRYWWELILGYAIGVLAGWGYEMVSTSGKVKELVEMLLPIAALILAVGVVIHFKRIVSVFEAIKKKEFGYWLRTWELPPWVTGQAPVPAEGPSAEGESDEAPASTTSGCPHCGAETEPGDRFCGVCENPLDQAPVAPGCPHCGAETEPGDRFCGVCENPLT